MCWFLWNIFIALEWVSGGKEKKRDRKRKRKLASKLSGSLFYFWKSQNKVELNANYIKTNRHQHHQRYSKYCRGTLMLATCQGDHGFWIPFHLPGFRNLKFIWSMCQFLILSTKWFGDLIISSVLRMPVFSHFNPHIYYNERVPVFNRLKIGAVVRIWLAYPISQYTDPLHTMQCNAMHSYAV